MSNQDKNRNYNSRSNQNRTKSSGKKPYQKGGSVPQRRKPSALKLNWWQKLLKAIGLYKGAGKKPSASPKRDRSTSSRSSNSTNTRQPSPPQKVESPRLYVGNLSYEVSETELTDLFKGFGAVKKVEIIYNNRTHRSKGFAFIEMMKTEDAKRASEVLHEQPFMGRNMIVNGARVDNPDREPVA